MTLVLRREEWEESRVRKGLAKVAGAESCRAGPRFDSWVGKIH